MATKNLCGKTRTPEQPYEQWESFAENRSGGPAFIWKVLKKYQAPAAEAKNGYARWLVATIGPGTFGGYDLGDEYVGRIVANGHRVFVDPTIADDPIAPKRPAPESLVAFGMGW
jgi:hypothetical protein